MDVAMRKQGDNVAADLGLKPKELARVAEGLAGVLADTYLLYLKTQNFHWNVTGPMFGELHSLFEQQYTDLATAVDELAERIRAIGEFAPGELPAIPQAVEDLGCGKRSAGGADDRDRGGR